MDNVIPKISVIMPFYNAARFLDAAILSILNQTFTDFEFIVINDASTDNADDIVKKYLYDQRIVYIKNDHNLGIVANLNHGLRIATAPIIARMDGDDVSDVTRLEKQFNFLINHPEVAAVGTYIKIIDTTDTVIDQRTKPTDFSHIKKDLIIYSPLVHATVMFRKQAIEVVGTYRPEYLYCEDLDLFYRLIYSGYRVSNIPEFLYHYRYHEHSVAHRSNIVAKKLFRLRHETIKNFHLRPNLFQQAMIYLQYVAGTIFSGRQRQRMEGFYKTIFYHGK